MLERLPTDILNEDYIPLASKEFDFSTGNYSGETDVSGTLDLIIN
jgi:hypothetical protein